MTSEMSTDDGHGTRASRAAAPPAKNVGSQTLDRGIRALVMVAAAPGGMTVQEVADRLEVHRTIAHRLLATLADHHLISRGPDNRFRAGGGLTAGQRSAEPLRDTALPIMRELADELESTVVLLVREGEEVVGIAVASPTTRRTTWRFGPGAVTRWAAAPRVSPCCRRSPPGRASGQRSRRARTQGFAVSRGEVEPGAHGLAVLIHQGVDVPSAA